MRRERLATFVLAVVLFCAPSLRAQSAAAVRHDDAAGPASVDLQTRLNKVVIEDGAQGVRVRLDDELGPRSVSADEYLRLIRRAQLEQQSHDLYVLLNITSAWGVLWVSVGFLGQALFTFRMVLQWLASEKHKRSVVPVGFWWGSLLGGLMLLTYFIWRKDIVGILGQSTGVFVYARNLILIYRTRPSSLVESTA